MHEPVMTQPLALDEDGELDYDACVAPEVKQENVGTKVLAIELIELSVLRKENKQLKEQLEALKKENMQLQSQLEARDTWLQ